MNQNITKLSSISTGNLAPLHPPDAAALETKSLSELYENAFLSGRSIILDLLFPGVYLLVGDAKIGKSFLASQLAFCVASGMPFWERAVQKSTALYLALEDQYSRIQQRMYQMFGTEESADLHFAVHANLLGDGLERQLETFVSAHETTRLIIVDTLQKIRGSADAYSYAKDYEVISRLKAFAEKHALCLLFIHHTRKQNSSDPFGKINGTTGLLGASDGVWLLTKDCRTSNLATLEISGRDQPDTKILLERDPETLRWNLVSFETELWKMPPDPLLVLLTEKLNEIGGNWSGTATELATFLGTDLKPNTLSMKLNVNASTLLHDFKISVRTSRNHDGRRIELQRVGDDP